MSEVKITIQNDNKDEQKSDLPEQASPDTSVHMHAPQDEEKDVRRTVLHKEEEHETRGEEIDAENKRTSKDAGVFGNDKEYVVCFDYSRRPDGQYPQGAYPAQGQQPPAYPAYPPPYGAQDPYGQPPQAPYGGLFGQQNPRPPDQVYNMSEPPLYYTDDNEDRNVFVRKVTLVTFIMLLLTTAFVAAVLFVLNIPGCALMFCYPPFTDVMLESVVLHNMLAERKHLNEIGMIALSCVMPTAMCARQFPTNFVCLFLVLIFQSLFCATITCMYKTHILLQALIATLVVVLICVILACTSFDFTKLILYVIAIGVAFSVLSLVLIISMLVFHFYSKPLMIALVFGLTLLSVVTLIMDLQMILGGKSIELSEADYALGAFMLYTSIIDIFLKLVILLQQVES